MSQVNCTFVITQSSKDACDPMNFEDKQACYQCFKDKICEIIESEAIEGVY